MARYPWQKWPTRASLYIVVGCGFIVTMNKISWQCAGNCHDIPFQNPIKRESDASDGLEGTTTAPATSENPGVRH